MAVTNDLVITRLRRSDNSGFKAPRDVREISREQGFHPVDFDANGTFARKLVRAVIETPRLLWLLSRASDGQTVVSQYPLGLVCDSILSWKRWRFRRVAFIHDVETLRHGRQIARDVRQLENFDAIVVHNEIMREWVSSSIPGFDGTLVTLQIFDYLVREDLALPEAATRPECAYVVGNLAPHKAGFLYGGEGFGFPVRCFGGNVEISALRPGTVHLGHLDQDAPTLNRRDGFGLVWDGPEPSGLVAPAGQYLRYNSPHKLSCYLMLGLPVIVSRESALAAFVLDQGVGLAVSGLPAVADLIAGVGPEEWCRLLENVASLRAKLRAGWFTSVALHSARSVEASSR